MEQTQKAQVSRACSKCGGDLGSRFRKQRYCRKCKATYERNYRVVVKGKEFNKAYNVAIGDVLKIIPNQYKHGSLIEAISKLKRSNVKQN